MSTLRSTLSRSRIDRHILRQTLRLLVLLALAVFVLVPYIWILITSLKNPQEIFVTGWRTFVPSSVSLAAYGDVFTRVPYARWAFNSFFVAGLMTLGQMLVAVPAAYAFARYRFPLHRTLFFIVLGTLMIPPQAIMVPSYVLMVQLNWLDTYQGLIVPHLASGFAVFWLRQYFLTVPRDLDDAAAVDGCTSFQRLRHIYVPLAVPIIAALTAISFVANWNEYYWPLLITTDETMRTLPLAIVRFTSAENIIEWAQTGAAIVMATSPTLIIFLFIQRQFIEGFTSAGLKG